MPDSRTYICSRSNGLDIGMVFNTRTFWKDSEFEDLFNSVNRIVDGL